ncbi:hypothetical protein KY385_00510 [Candidatus Parcubacteria bacterium]|nr:hypothetical protein [Candidatus Parcubacteria bacterium]
MNVNIGEVPNSVLPEPTISEPIAEGLTSDNYDRYAAEIDIGQQRADGLLDLTEAEQQLLEEVEQSGQVTLTGNSKQENNLRYAKYRVAKAKQSLAPDPDGETAINGINDNSKQLLLLTESSTRQKVD